MQYCFSRFAHEFRSESATCYLNSLKLRPVYVQNEFALLLQDIYRKNQHHFFNAHELISQNRCYAEILKSLEEEKIIAASPEVDNVLHKIRASLPAPQLAIMYLVVTEQCNLSCSYCFMNSSLNRAKHPHRQHMSITTAQKALDFFCSIIGRSKGSFEEEKTIIIYGGEPLTNRDCVLHIPNQIQELKLRKMLPEETNSVINTNSTLLTEELVKAIKPSGTSISLSIDGGTAEFNHHRRYCDGRETFDNVISAINLLRQHQVNFGLSITLSEDVLLRADELLASIEQLNIQNIGVNPIIPSKDSPSSEQYSELVAQFIIKAYKRLHPLGFSEDRIARKIICFANAALYPWDCGAGGGRQVVVAPNGDVGICHGLIGERTDFVTRVDNLDFDPGKSEVFWKWRNFSPLCHHECEACSALGICGGGCPLRAYEMSGKWNSIDKQFCSHAKKTLEFLVWEYWRRLQKTAAQRERSTYETEAYSAA